MNDTNMSDSSSRVYGDPLYREVLIEEYKTCTQEIQNRLTNQQQVTNFAITLFAGFFAIVQFVPSSQNSQVFYTYVVPILPLISIIFTAFGFQILENDFYMAILGKYINSSLRPQLDAIIEKTKELQPEILQWEDYRNKQVFNIVAILFTAAMSASRYVAVCLVPALVSLFFYYEFRNPSTEAEYSVWLFWIAVGFLSIATLTVVHILFLYAGNSSKRSKSAVIGDRAGGR